MLKKAVPLLLSAVALFALLVSLSAPAAAADNNQYRIVLRYYDPIQITYTIQYPASDDRGEWTGPEDVPVGGVGVPDANNKFGINPYLSTQIYCVDPFTPFHGQVPGLGGSFEWDTGSMADTVTGYVEAAPWVTSGAMQVYGDAVRWLAANGYRGVYNYGGTDDAESQASVARLNTMFPSIGPIDKEIAVMATKVAIWKIVAGDSVQIKSTTLDGTPKRATFDALVQALVSEAEKTLLPSPRAALPGEAAVTSFDVHIAEDAGAFYDEDVDTAYNYYGPLTAQATLSNAAPGADLSGMDKVFLTANGLNSDGVRFVSQKSADSADALPTGTLYGTSQETQYITGSGTGSTWTSDEFYLAIPKSRDVPARGDQLMIRAMAMAPEIPVEQGTPVVFAFAQNDVQDWRAIQAFIGGTSAGQQINLYAETRWDTGDTTLGDLNISKQVSNAATPEDSTKAFTFAVYYNDTDNFDTAHRLNLTDNPVRGAYSVDTENNTFTLTNGDLALIQGLPMTVSGGTPGYEYYYWVEEQGLSGQGYETPHFELSAGKPAGLSADGDRIGPFQLDTDTGLAYITATNTISEIPVTGGAQPLAVPVILLLLGAGSMLAGGAWLRTYKTRHAKGRHGI